MPNSTVQITDAAPSVTKKRIFRDGLSVWEQPELRKNAKIQTQLMSQEASPDLTGVFSVLPSVLLSWVILERCLK